MLVIDQIMRFLVICLIGIVFFIPVKRKTINGVALDKAMTNRMKGLACIMVVVGHATKQLDGKLVFSITNNLGFIALGIFFFISGYGLMHSFINKENYLRGFLKRRLLLILIPFWSSNIFFCCYSLIIGEKYSLKEIIERLIGIKLFVVHDWYIQTIIIFYVLFFIMAKVLKNNNRVLIGILAVTIIMICLSQLNVTYIPNNTCSCSTFFVGALLAYNKKIVERIVLMSSRWIMLIAFVAVMFYSYTFILRYHTFDSLLLFKIGEFICPLLVVFVVLFIVNKYSFGNRLFDLICICSYEVFLMHQFAIDIGEKVGISASLDLIIIMMISLIMGYILYLWDNLMRKGISIINKK